MLISAAPVAIPVTTANLPTEAVAREVIVRPRIPQPTSPTDSTANKNSTEFSEQGKPNAESNLPDDRQLLINDREQGSREQGTQEQNKKSEPQGSGTQRTEQELDPERLVQVRQLRSRDREVRAHEQAHAAVGGSLTGPPSLAYTTGPDGKRYAVSGEVSIDTSVISGDPAATIRKLDQVRRAALAPAAPSSQDRRVASSASVSANQTRTQIRVDKVRESTEAQETEVEGDPQSLREKANRSAPYTALGNGRQAEQLSQRLVRSGAFAQNKVGINVSVIV